MGIIDAYVHVAMPRFLSVAALLRLMDRHDVEAAVLSTAETCPDVLGMSRAILAHPDRLRAIGMPLGNTHAGIRDGIKAQLDSGFSGIRLPAAFLADNPDVLDLLAQANAIPLVVGERGLKPAARLLANYMAHDPQRRVIAGHFAGPADPILLDTDADISDMFAQPGFHVAFTRHGALGQFPLEGWALAIVARIGWSRVLWGSEWPVALWRDETYSGTLDWVARLSPSPDDLKAIRHDNATRLFFTGSPPSMSALDPRWDMMHLRRQADVWLFPPSLDVAEKRHQDLMLAYENWGGEQAGRYSEFMLSMAERGIAAKN